MRAGFVIALAVWALLASGGAFLAFRAYTLADARAQEYKGQYEATKARLGRIQAQVQAVERRRDKANHKLQEALNADPAWRDAAVPDAVSNSLCQHLRCK